MIFVGFAPPSDSEGENDYATPFSKSSNVTADLFDKPLDLSGDDFDDENDENDYYDKNFKDIFD